MVGFGSRRVYSETGVYSENVQFGSLGGGGLYFVHGHGDSFGSVGGGGIYVGRGAGLATA